MRVTHVSVTPTAAALEAGRPGLTPELLAAVGARYSRSNDGLDAILGRIDPENPDKSVDAIFKFVDYGHASISDMTPVALFVDGVSQWLAYYLWSLCPTAGGQESSTRYLKLDSDGLIDGAALGVSDPAWAERMESAFDAYRGALTVWEGVSQRHPERVRIPDNTPPKAAARMRRNFVFDRARYFLPAAVATNVMLIQSARAWVALCQHLLSHPLPEAQRCGAAIRVELELVAPRLIKHARPVESIQRGLAAELAARQAIAKQTCADGEATPTARLDTLSAPGVDTSAADLAFHDNRYAYIGEGLRRTAVRFAWDAVALAELRDLNRHRTGTKWCPLAPVGFYGAEDELPAPDIDYDAFLARGREASEIARQRLASGDPGYVYDLLLGTQTAFEHTTTADKFLYEAELRTGVGAHYRYARHLRDTLTLWYGRYPQTRGLVLEGSAEPE